MRVNPDMSGDILAAIWQTQSQENTALQQMSSGKRVNVPSDDPLAAAQMIGNQAQSDRADQYLQNVDTLTNQLQTADTALGSAVRRSLKPSPSACRAQPEHCLLQTGSRSCKICREYRVSSCSWRTPPSVATTCSEAPPARLLLIRSTPQIRRVSFIAATAGPIQYRLRTA